jgi:hypothetical protein
MFLDQASYYVKRSWYKIPSNVNIPQQDTNQSITAKAALANHRTKLMKSVNKG